MAKKKRNAGGAKRSPVKKQTQAVDVVTGKTTVEYFFDPSLILSTSNSSSNDDSTSFKSPNQPVDEATVLSSKHLFMPCTIVKPLESSNNNNNNEENKNNSSTGKAVVDTQPYAGPTLVKIKDGTLYKISDSTKLIPLRTPDDYLGVEDILHLQQVSEASLVHTLRMRYKREEIYTSAGPILISINPYRSVSVSHHKADSSSPANGGAVASVGDSSLYSEDQMLFYRTKSSSAMGAEKPPHLFQIADRAYSALIDSVHSSKAVDHLEDEDAVLLLEDHHGAGMLRNQSIIISGESGAGKTEATKIIMKYLARITRKADRPSFLQSPDGKQIAALEDRVLSSNPLLETFGNARTLRNDNSSRFGKFIHIYFDTVSGSITGASIRNYLLEKTRITTQVEGERNYHIFYQLLAGSTDKELEEWGLQGGTSHFTYLGKQSPSSSSSSSSSSVTTKDASDLQETKDCLRSLGVSYHQQATLFAMAAAVLHLGNIEFETKTDEIENEAAAVLESTRPSLTKACELLGLDESAVEEAILTKRLVVNGKTIKKSQTVGLAADKRDALAKMTYSNMFLWLVQCINETLLQNSVGTSQDKKSAAEHEVGFIGVLDIYGFECFETNGFEQLLINYCNEKLQRHFNRHLFEVEQELYANEGVDWSYITFNDNKPCLELIEGGSGSVGILNTLDDAWGGMGTTSEKDGKFVAQLHKLFGTLSMKNEGKEQGGGGHKHFITPKFGKDMQFLIAHYAGEVRYTADGFVEKNMETLSNELRDLGLNSTDELSKAVFQCGVVDTSSSTRSSIRGVSVGAQFRSSLQELVSDLDRTQPHYIRCIKPNLTKAPNVFMTGEVLKQLRYSGMMEAIRIRREGYALREKHESFYNRFSVLLTSEDVNGDESGIEQLVRVLSKRLHVTDADWQIGHSKIFLRRELSDKLERLARLRVHAAAVTLSRFGRRLILSSLSRLLVTWMRFRLKMKKLYREFRAASLMAAWVRRCKQERKYLDIKQAMIRLQSAQRRKLATARVLRIRDPYHDLTFKDCKRLLKSEQERLEQAVKSKKFRQAADLEAKIASLQAAIERKQPITRPMIDQKIALISAALEEAVQKKAFNECDALQAQLDEWTEKQQQLPTMDELREKVRLAEDEVALAAKNKNFAGAAEAQAKLDALRVRLEEEIAAETGGDYVEEVDNVLGFESRTQLEIAIRELAKEVKQAISEKNFAKASELQQNLDEREGLRKFFPTVDELRTKLDKERKLLEAALAKKDFTSAGKIDQIIAELQSKLASEEAKMKELNVANNDGSSLSMITLDGDERQFKTRVELEAAVSDISKKLSEAVKNKQFKKAEEIQGDIDKLTKLREHLPTIAELENKMKTLRIELNKSISAKEFARADQIHLDIEAIEARVKKEKEASPTPRETPSVKSAPVVTAAAAAGTPSVNSAYSTPAKRISNSRPVAIQATGGSKTVKSLRPAKPISIESTGSVFDVAQEMAARRGQALILTDPDGGLAGIMTDKDIICRVVGKLLGPDTPAEQVMTRDPMCVAMSSSANDALATMIENRFRHLPVTDESGAVVGLLDIAKCLNDAIDRLEKSEDKNRSAADKALQDVVNQSSGAQADAMKSLLQGLMTKAFGKSMPTLGSLVKGAVTAVSPETPLEDVAVIMAEHRKASLVVENGELVGIFGFKDMVTRVLAKELDIATTKVVDVMTPAPEYLTTNSTVLQALQLMHDHRFLTLPVCEEDGRPVGVVDVLDVMHACGGAEGWKSLFGGIELDDDMSDVTSVQSGTSKKNLVRPDPSQMEPVKETDERTVIKLRPSKPILASSSDSVLSVCQLLRLKRSAAALLVGEGGGLSGILTDTDVTRRVVSKSLDPANLSVSLAMTPDPRCVSTTDSAMEALTIMVENRFRHLPVVDDSGSIVGLLDIAKCLNDAITKLERAKRKDSDVANDLLKDVVGGGAQAAALQALLGDLMTKAFGGNKVPTLGSLLAGKPSSIVSPSATVYDAALLMTENRKAVLVVDDDSGKLVGIFGFKDMMSRVVAKELDVELTPISEVMTVNPDSVTPQTNVVEALQVMHDHKFLTLPVCEEDGTVVGIVDVLDVVYGCGGIEGWRSMFQTSLDVADDRSTVSSHTENKSVTTKSTTTAKKKKHITKNDKTVEKLRPTKPVLCSTEETVLLVSQTMQKKRAAAALLVNPSGALAGIFTDHDLNNRALSKNMDPSLTLVSEVMTPNPSHVATNESATEALMLMVEGHFRYLPVTAPDGSLTGILDIAKCLNDAISKLEKSHKKGTSVNDQAVQDIVDKQGASGAQAAALQQLLSTLMAQAFGKDSMPTLRSMLPGVPETVVEPTATVRDVSYIMAENKKAVLVVDNDELIGIFGFKDMMTRVVAKGLPLETTLVQDVMSEDPETVTPDMTALEALQTMHDNRFLTLPVCEENGRVVGVVDVLDVMHACGGAEGWRSMFAQSMELDDNSDAASATQSKLTGNASKAATAKKSMSKIPDTPMAARALPGNIPTTLEFDEFDEKSGSKLPDDMSASIDTLVGVFKVTDTEGHAHKIRCPCRASDLLQTVANKMQISPKSLTLTFIDEEGDPVAITSDEDVVEAFNHARRHGETIAKLTATKTSSKGVDLEPVVLVGACLAVVGAISILFLRPRR